MKWSIQVDYEMQDDDGVPRRARTVFHAEGETIAIAYASAESAFAGRKVKLGAIIPGHKNGVF